MAIKILKASSKQAFDHCPLEDGWVFQGAPYFKDNDDTVWYQHITDEVDKPDD